MRKHFSILLGLFSLLGGATSCLGNAEVNETGHYTDIFTVSGSLEDGYLFYGDSGNDFIPSATSVYNITDNNGFGKARRLYMYFTYNNDNIKTDPTSGKTVFKDADIQSYSVLPCKEPLSLTAADSLLVTSKDSTWDFSLNNVFLSNGFLNVFWNGYCSVNKAGKDIRPTLQLVYDDKNESDTVKFTVYYNRHDTLNAPSYKYPSEMIDCFDLVPFVKSLPASDSIIMSIKTEKSNSRVAKFARKWFSYPY